MKKVIAVVMVLVLVCFSMVGCGTTKMTSTQRDQASTLAIGEKLAQTQPTPTDFTYSLERWNLIRRAYWVNGEREKARAVPRPIDDIPLSYVMLIDHGVIFGMYAVDGKVSSQNSFLTPDSEAFEGTPSSMRGTNANGEVYNSGTYVNKWLPDVDGSFGVNDDGIFFFEPNGQYHTWNSTVHYQDTPFSLQDVAALNRALRGD